MLQSKSFFLKYNTYSIKKTDNRNKLSSTNNHHANLSKTMRSVSYLIRKYPYPLYPKM